MPTHPLPESPNLYATLHAPALTPEALARHYAAAGWQVRACGWAEWELRQPWAELVAEAASPLLLHGRVQPSRARDALAPLLTLPQLQASAELYDEADALCDTWALAPLPPSR